MTDLTVTIGADDAELARGFDRAIGRVQSFGQKATQMGAVLSAAVSLPLALVGKSALSMAADMESASVSFRVLLKDANLAKYAVAEFKKFAAQTPFEFKEVQGGAKQLLSYGYALKDVIPALTNAGDLASGMGVSISEVVQAMGRLKSGNFGESFERFREFGIGRDQLEGKGLVFDKSGQYKGSVDAAMKAVNDVIKERFGGQMAEQAKTLGGIWSNIQDQISFGLADLGNGIAEAFNLKELGPKLADTIGKIVGWFKELSPFVQKAALAFGALLIVGPPLLVALGGIMTIVGMLGGVFGAILSPIGLVVAAIAAAAIVIYHNWDSIKKTLTDNGMWASLKTIAKAGLTAFASLFGVVGNFIQGDWHNTMTHLKNLTKSGMLGLLTALYAAAGPLVGFFAGLWRKMGNNGMADWLDNQTTLLKAGIDKLQGQLPPLKNAVSSISDLFAGLGGDTKPPPKDDKGGGGKTGGDALGGKSSLISEYEAEAKRLYDVAKDFWASIKAITGDGTLNPITGKRDGLAMSNIAIVAPAIPIGPSFLQPLADLQTQMNTMLGDMALSAFEGMSGVVGGLLSGTVGMADLGGILGGMLGGMLTQMGQAYLKQGILMTALIPALSNPITSGPGLLAAGAAMSVLGGLLKAATTGKQGKRYATGGIPGQNQLGVFNDYASWQTDPEAVLRLSQVQNIVESAMQRTMPKMGSFEVQPVNMNINGSFRMDGRDMVMVLGENNFQLSRK